MFRSKKIRNSLVVLFSVALTTGGLYWFFTKTNRGSSIALYTVGGWHAPLSVHWNCGKETDRRVEEKFKLPLKFDKESKDLLRGFWYYSYFRECLFGHGYDFSGYRIPASAIIKNGEKALYENIYAGVNFAVVTDTTISLDNKLDVDVDDRLYVSKLETNPGVIEIKTYITKGDGDSLREAIDQLDQLSKGSKALIRDVIVKNYGEEKVLRIKREDGSLALTIFTPARHILYITATGTTDGVLEHIAESLTFIAK